jgi:hypothetical protein
MMPVSGYTVRRWSNGRNDSGWVIEDSDGKEVANCITWSDARLITKALNKQLQESE